MTPWWESCCMEQIHGGLWAWPCLHEKGHDGDHSWVDEPCVCHAGGNAFARRMNALLAEEAGR